MVTRILLTRFAVMVAATVANAQAPPELSRGDIDGQAHKLIEIHVQPSPPDGYQVLGQEWLVLDPAVDWRQYDNGSVFICTAPPGTYQARWRGQYIRLEPFDGKSEWRVYTINIRGPPSPVVVDPVVDPVVEPDPTTPGPARQVTYIYENERGPVPRSIQSALRELRDAGIQATAIDQHIIDGQGNIPRQYRTALGAADDVPVMVVEGDRGVIAVVKNPTAADVLKYK